MKTVADCKVGDTITEDRNPVSTMLPGFKPSVPVVFVVFSQWIMPPFSDLKPWVSSLNDASLDFENET